MPPSDSETARWFAEEVQPHEAELRAYLRPRFAAHLDVDDLVQETYARLLQARAESHIRSLKAYLFTTARHVAFDHFRRRKIVSIENVAEIDDLPVLEERPDVAEHVAHTQELHYLAEALQSLPERCRRVVTLRKIYGLSHREIAAQLGISENTVNAQIATGVLRLRDFFKARGMQRRDER